MRPPAAPGGCATRTRHLAWGTLPRRRRDAWGVSPQGRRRQRRRESGRRLPLAEALPVRRLGGTARAHLHSTAEEAGIVAARERSGARPPTVGARLSRSAPLPSVGADDRRAACRADSSATIPKWSDSLVPSCMLVMTSRDSTARSSLSATWSMLRRPPKARSDVAMRMPGGKACCSADRSSRGARLPGATI